MGPILGYPPQAANLTGDRRPREAPKSLPECLPGCFSKKLNCGVKMAAVGRENATLEASWEAPGRSSGVPHEAFQEAPGPSEARVRHQADVTVIFKSRVAPKTLPQASQEARWRRPGASQEASRKASSETSGRLLRASWDASWNVFSSLFKLKSLSKMATAGRENARLWRPPGTLPERPPRGLPGGSQESPKSLLGCPPG